MTKLGSPTSFSDSKSLEEVRSKNDRVEEIDDVVLISFLMIIVYDKIEKSVVKNFLFFRMLLKSGLMFALKLVLKFLNQCVFDFS